MKELKGLLVCLEILLILSVFIGCASAPTAEDIKSADYGPHPDNYEQIIKDYFSTKLFDPYTAKYTFTNPRKGYNRLGGLKYGWYVCGTVNAKNRFGGYVGAKPFYVLIHYGIVVKETDDFGDSAFNRGMLKGLCK